MISHRGVHVLDTSEKKDIDNSSPSCIANSVLFDAVVESTYSVRIFLQFNHRWGEPVL